MDTRIMATKNMIEKFHDSIRLGLTVEDSLILAGISKRDFATMNRAFYLKRVLNKEVSIEEVPPLYRPCEEDLIRYDEDEEFQKKINELDYVIIEVERNKIRLKKKLLEDINKAQEYKTSNWMASKWLLEQIDPKNYGKTEKETSDSLGKADVKVEFISNDSQSDRLKAMEKQVDKEINGVEKA